MGFGVQLRFASFSLPISHTRNEVLEIRQQSPLLSISSVVTTSELCIYLAQAFEPLSFVFCRVFSSNQSLKTAHRAILFAVIHGISYGATERKGRKDPCRPR